MAGRGLGADEGHEATEGTGRFYCLDYSAFCYLVSHLKVIPELWYQLIAPRHFNLFIALINTLCILRKCSIRVLPLSTNFDSSAYKISK